MGSFCGGGDGWERASRAGQGRRERASRQGRRELTEGAWWTAVCHFVWLESVVWLGRGSILEVSFLWLLLLFSFFLPPNRLVSDLLLLSSPLTLRCAGGDDPTFGKTGQGFVFVVSDAHCVSSVFPHSIVYGAEHLQHEARSGDCSPRRSGMFDLILKRGSGHCCRIQHAELKLTCNIISTNHAHAHTHIYYIIYVYVCV